MKPIIDAAYPLKPREIGLRRLTKEIDAMPEASELFFSILSRLAQD